MSLTGSVWKDLKHYTLYGGVVIRLLLLNIAVFLVLGVLQLGGWAFGNDAVYQFVEAQLVSYSSLSILISKPWTPFTYMFTHTGFLHLLFNLLWMWWFAQIYGVYMGNKHLLTLYIGGGLVGYVLYALAYHLLPPLQPLVDSSHMMGASACVFSIGFATAAINPDHPLHLFLLGDIKLKWLLLIFLALDLLNIPNGNAGGYIAHAGGALFGYVFMRFLQQGWQPSFSKGNRMKVTQRNPQPRFEYAETAASASSSLDVDSDEQERVDEILDKIGRSGYESLSSVEKEFLFRYSNK